MKRLSRRHVLRGGGVALGLPVLDAMLPRSVRAQEEMLSPRRIVFEYKPNGDQPDRRMTNFTERDFAFDEFLEPLEPYRDDLVVLDYINKQFGAIPQGQRADNHQTGGNSLAPWTFGEGDFPVGGESRTIGYVEGPSADYVIGSRLWEIGVEVPFRHLVYRVGGRGNHIWNLHSHAGPEGKKNPVIPETDPVAAYARLFAATGDTPEAEAVRERIVTKASLLDLVVQDNNTLLSRLSAADREKIDLYTDSLRDIERTLIPPKAAAGCMPVEPSFASDPYDNDNHVEVGLAFYKVMAMALACDLTRSINFNWGGNSDNRVYRNLGLEDGHHDISHRSDAEAFAQIRRIHRHLWTQSVQLYEDLKAIPEGDGSVYDNTLIVHWNELGQGDVHSWLDCLMVLAGGAAGYFDRGRYVNLANMTSFSDVLTTCFHYMGFEDVEGFGDPRFALRGALHDIKA